MTRDDIIRMAREVFDVETDSRGRETFSSDNYGVERFAALVAAAERETIIQFLQEMQRAVGDAHNHYGVAAVRIKAGV